MNHDAQNKAQGQRVKSAVLFVCRRSKDILLDNSDIETRERTYCSMTEDQEVSESPSKRQRREELVAVPTTTTTTTTTTTNGNDEKAPPKDATTVVQPLVEVQTPKLFIGGLHRSVTETHVEKLMMPYGTIVRVNLILQPGTGNSKGFAFCQYQRAEDAAAAVAALDGRTLLGKRILVKPAHEQQRSGVGGLHKGSSAPPSAPLSAASTEKERRNIESKIQAVKRKIQQAQQKELGR